MDTLKQWTDKYFGLKVDGRVRSFRIVLCVGFISTVLMQFILFAVYNSLKFHAVGLLLGLGIAFVFYLTSVIDNLTWIYWGYLFCVNDIIIVWFFIKNDGVSTYAQIWLLVGFMMMFIFLDGMPLYSLCAVSLFACGGAYACFIPQYGARAMIIRFATFIFWGVGIGMVFRYQIMKLSDERHLSEMRQKEIEAISDAKLRFFDNMSHDIRIPINTIVGLNEMTLRNTVSDEVYENSVNIQKASEILLTLIDDIVDLNKIEAGNLEIVPVKYKLNELIAELVNMVWDRAQNKGLGFTVDMGKGCPSVLYGDVVRIKQVLTNILTNAIKYTEQGSVTFKISGDLISHRCYRMKFCVKDTGIGIRDGDIVRLFETFKRVNEEKTGSIEGTGLGLSISKQLMDLMNGTITVESVYQKGSAFTVTIEQEVIDGRPARLSDLSQTHSDARHAYRNIFEAPDARILAVDDDEMNLLVIRKLLKDTKMTVDTVLSGRECLETTLHNSYDVIIMDYLMPEMNGEEALKSLRSRQDGYCQDTPVILLTGNVMANAEETYEKKGFDAYLSKPVNGELLEKAILNVLPDALIESADESVLPVNEASYASGIPGHKKKKVGIAALGVIDIPEEIIMQYDIRLIHSRITTEEGSFTDTEEVSTSGLMEYLDEGKFAKAAETPVEEYKEFFEKCLEKAEKIIFFTMTSASMPYIYKNLLTASERFSDRVYIFDSMNISSGMGFLTVHAAKMASDGAETEDIIRACEQMRSRVSTVFTVDSTESLYRNKWIGKGIRDMCNLLGLHPIIAMIKGKMTVTGITAGSWESMAVKFVRMRLKNKRNIDDRCLFVAYTGLSEKQQRFIADEISKYIAFKEVFFIEATSAISAHCGNGMFGLLYMKG